MVSSFRNSLSRKPLQETNTNVVKDASVKFTSRSWWPLRSFSAEKQVVSQRRPEYTQSKKQYGNVVIISVDSKASLTSILTQVRGGPLKSVHQLQSEPHAVILLEFLNEADARIFRQYVEHSKCFVHGIQVFISLIPEAVWASLLQSRAPQPFPGPQRRTLELFKFITPIYHRPLLYCPVNQVYVRQMFSQIGPVLEVRPMIYQRHVAFAIDFANMDSAIAAKQVFTEESQIDRHIRRSNPKYNRFPGLHSWSLDFTSDGAERNCVF